MRTPLILVATSALALAACGSDGADDAVEQLADADQLIADGEELGISPLALAFEQTAGAEAFRLEMAMGMSMDIGFGDAIDFAADPANPMMVAERDAQGEQHVVVDMGSMVDGMGAGGALGNDMGVEMWVAGTTLYADYGSLGTLMATSGMNVPDGIFTVDLTALGDTIGGADIASSITGQAIPDPVEMANVLKEVLTDAEADGTVYSGTIGFLDYSRAMGQDEGALSGSLDGLEEMVDAEALLAIFDEMEVDVEVTVANGAADVIRFDIDMTPMFAGMVEAFGDDDASMAGLGNLFADATMTMEMVMDYDIDATIDVIIPEGDFPDVTDDFASLMEFGGPFG